MGILAVAWIIVFLGMIIIFKFIVPMPDIILGGFGAVITAVLKALMATALGITWLLIMIWLRNMYAKRKVLRRTSI